MVMRKQEVEEEEDVEKEKSSCEFKGKEM
jgi:hypothetical protein